MLEPAATKKVWQSRPPSVRARRPVQGRKERQQGRQRIVHHYAIVHVNRTLLRSDHAKRPSIYYSCSTTLSLRPSSGLFVLGVAGPIIIAAYRHNMATMTGIEEQAAAALIIIMLPLNRKLRTTSRCYLSACRLPYLTLYMYF